MAHDLLLGRTRRNWSRGCGHRGDGRKPDPFSDVVPASRGRKPDPFVDVPTPKSPRKPNPFVSGSRGGRRSSLDG